MIKDLIKKIKADIKSAAEKMFNIYAGILFTIGCVLGNYCTNHNCLLLLTIIALAIPLAAVSYKLVFKKKKIKNITDA